ncbi:MAG TPA: endonuclease III [Candidatus Binatia bacterium]
MPTPSQRPARSRSRTAANATTSTTTAARARVAAQPTTSTAKSKAKTRPEAKTSPVEPKATPREILARLEAAIPEPRCELEHRSAWELLIATILSAQSTDKMVNSVTPELFARWPTPQALADAPPEEVEKVVHRTGFFRSKTKAIQSASAMIADEFGGEVPRTMEEMLRLPGVARKTANVVLGTAYGIAEGVVVDTHAMRVSQRLGLTAQSDPSRIEDDLRAAFPRREWIDLGHRLVLHGRYVCLARAPRCEICPLNELCPSAQLPPHDTWRMRARREREIVESRGAAAQPADGLRAAKRSRT